MVVVRPPGRWASCRGKASPSRCTSTTAITFLDKITAAPGSLELPNRRGLPETPFSRAWNVSNDSRICSSGSDHLSPANSQIKENPMCIPSSTCSEPGSRPFLLGAQPVSRVPGQGGCESARPLRDLEPPRPRRPPPAARHLRSTCAPPARGLHSARSPNRESSAVTGDLGPSAAWACRSLSPSLPPGPQSSAPSPPCGKRYLKHKFGRTWLH